MKYFLGVLLVFLSALSYAFMVTLVKVVSNSDQPPSFMMILFFEALVATGLVALYINKQFIRVLKTGNITLLLLRGVFGFAMSLTSWISVKYFPVANIIILNNSAPLFIPLIALIILRQKIDHIMWIPILVGFLGVYLVAAPKTIMLNYPSILALCSGLFFAGVLTVSI